MIGLRTTTGLVDCRAFMRDASNVSVEIAPKMRNAANVLVDLYAATGGGPLAASASPLDAYGATAGARLAKTQEITVTATGGRLPYSFSWAVAGGGAASSPTGSVTRITAMLSSGDSISGTAVCTVTDANGDAAASETVNYALESFDTGYL